MKDLILEIKRFIRIYRICGDIHESYYWFRAGVENIEPVESLEEV